MSNRFKTALQINSGASNPRAIANELVKAIDEVRAESGGVASDADPAVFLILHQLTWVLCKHDITLATDHLGERWKQANAACEAKAAVMAPALPQA